jgi:hypothetical protein
LGMENGEKGDFPDGEDADKVNEVFPEAAQL